MIKEINIVNKRARFDYEILESYSAGMVLTGDGELGFDSGEGA